jgi:hypothetical protein
LAGAGIQIQANGQINSNVTLTLATLSPFLTTSNVAEGSNLYYTNARVYSAIQSNLATKANVSDLTTANVSELTNQYFTNARAVLAIAPYLTTSNISEGSNLYYTNARVVSAVTPYLTTANVIETSANLYFTNARVLANVSQMSINVFADVDISGINNDELLLWNAFDRIFRPSSFTGKLTTANVVELTNLYFTNARVITALSDGTANLTLYNLSTNGLLTVSSATTGESTTGIEFKNNPGGGTGDTAKIQYYAANIGVNDDTILEFFTVIGCPGL